MSQPSSSQLRPFSRRNGYFHLRPRGDSDNLSHHEAVWQMLAWSIMVTRGEFDGSQSEDSLVGDTSAKFMLHRGDNHDCLEALVHYGFTVTSNGTERARYALWGGERSTDEPSIYYVLVVQEPGEEPAIEVFFGPRSEPIVALASCVAARNNS